MESTNNLTLHLNYARVRDGEINGRWLNKNKADLRVKNIDKSVETTEPQVPNKPGRQFSKVKVKIKNDTHNRKQHNKPETDG